MTQPRGALSLLRGLVAVALTAAALATATAEARVGNGLIAYSVEGDACDVLGCVSRVWTIHPDGRARRKLPCSTRVDFGCVDHHPIFSPRGRRLATGTDGVSEGLAEGRPREVIAVRDPQGNVLRRIAVTGRPVSDLAWSGDGGRLAYNSLSPVYIVRRDGTRSRFYRKVNGDNIAWSRQGRLAWTTKDGTLFVTDASRRRVRRLKTRAGPPRWSPNGRHLAYKTGTDNRLEVLRPNGEGRRIVTRRCNADEDSVAWSPDGRQILCSTLAGSLLAVRVASGRSKIVLRGLFPQELDWQAVHAR